ncbi:class I SAM-dependent methyltransferase [Sphingobium sp.]|uniref:class I SAM-dependent methyltransferase n=1 Tax=Sphingobium sp. TaxID=1912891 RepID=UPI0028BF341C|nr:methyltransferase domain-containing protein [Sphingobium sp.]
MSEAPHPASQRVQAFQGEAVAHVVACEKLCAAIGLTAGTNVLDLACTSGHTALAAGRRRAIVTAVDANEALLSRARRLAEIEGLGDISFIAADPLATPFEDGAFDVVLSAFGLVFVRDQEAAARQLARLVRPGGTIALISHVRKSVPSSIYDFFHDFLPIRNGPANAHYEWSDGPRAAELLAPHFEAIRIERDHYDTCFASVEACYDHLVAHHPAIGPALAGMDEARVSAFREGYLAIVSAHNKATNGSLMAGVDYAVITARRALL